MLIFAGWLNRSQLDVIAFCFERRVPRTALTAIEAAGAPRCPLDALAWGHRWERVGRRLVCGRCGDVSRFRSLWLQQIADAPRPPGNAGNPGNAGVTKSP